MCWAADFLSLPLLRVKYVEILVLAASTFNSNISEKYKISSYLSYFKSGSETFEPSSHIVREATNYDVTKYFPYFKH